jgi:uncharacterized protein
MISPSKPADPNKAFKKAFFQGIVVVALFYSGVYAWVAVNADKTMQAIEDGLPSSIMLIDHAASLPEAYNYPPAPTGETIEHITEQPQPEDHTTTENVEVPSGPLQPAPFDGLYDTVVEGMLPKISASGQRPFDAYKRPYAASGTPKIALAVKNYGLSAGDSDKALALPPEVALILSPYSAEPELWQRKARESGHEVWLWLPMENTRFLEDDPGPRALLTHSSLPDNQKMLFWLLTRATGYAGVAAETDKAFMDMHAMLGELLNMVFSKGLGYLELNSAGSEFIETMAVAKGSPFVGVNEGIKTVNASTFTRLEETARKNGSAVAVMELTPRNVDDVREWALTLLNKGVVLAPVSAVVADKPLVKPEAPPQPSPSANQIIIHHE